MQSKSTSHQSINKKKRIERTTVSCFFHLKWICLRFVSCIFFQYQYENMMRMNWRTERASERANELNWKCWAGSSVCVQTTSNVTRIHVKYMHIIYTFVYLEKSIRKQKSTQERNRANKQEGVRDRETGSQEIRATTIQPNSSVSYSQQWNLMLASLFALLLALSLSVSRWHMGNRDFLFSNLSNYSYDDYAVERIYFSQITFTFSQ